MNKRRSGAPHRDRGGAGRRKPSHGAGPRRTTYPHRRPERAAGELFRPVEPAPAPEPEITTPGPFRVVIAVHRPRFRGRCERAAALTGWEVTALLNKQDPVGLVAKGPRPPDLLVLSGDFGRQRSYAIFRAVQAWRDQGMRLIGLVEDCETAPEGFPGSAPVDLCDVCIPPPYKTAELRSLFAGIYEEIRGRPAPPPKSAGDYDDGLDEEGE